MPEKTPARRVTAATGAAIKGAGRKPSFPSDRNLRKTPATWGLPRCGCGVQYRPVTTMQVTCDRCALTALRQVRP
jgi:hypothetical protein